ncbi:cyclase family protein [Spongiactinospora rosea]|uniref:Cyclase family protein n=1 Tax=Spongiactinospora rosea TaxID=2248750 RepID=A0A366LPG3_9ACTN|nr:cyclase family protein [Spongiactinospora rosea]RBQ15194.1 cyclase family protein [Spongiactinospora rosea]
MIVDLSVPIHSGMPVYPGDPEVTVSPALTVGEEGVNVLGLHLGSQSGTHVDAPYHIDDALPDLDMLPLDRFVGRATIADVRGLPPRTPIGPDALAPALRPGLILLIATGWAAHWGTGHYLAHPYLTPDAAALIIDSGVRTVAIDALSVDPTPVPDTDCSDPLPAHRVLCGAHAVIAENLRNLDVLLDARPVRPIEVSLLPIRIAGGDGAPIRAVARL